MNTRNAIIWLLLIVTLAFAGCSSDDVSDSSDPAGDEDSETLQDDDDDLADDGGYRLWALVGTSV